MEFIWFKVDTIYIVGLKSNLNEATTNPPKTPIILPIKTSRGTHIIAAKNLGQLDIVLVLLLEFLEHQFD